MCPNDEYYLTVFQNGWKLNEDLPGGGSASTLNLNRVEAVLRDKIYQKSEGSSEKAMKAVFKFFDTDGSGKVELKEFAKAMERFGIILMDDEMEGLFKKYDADNSGAMDYQEFIKGLMSVEPPRPPMAKMQVLHLCHRNRERPATPARGARAPCTCAVLTGNVTVTLSSY